MGPHAFKLLLVPHALLLLLLSLHASPSDAKAVVPEIEVTIPPQLEVGPPGGELLYEVQHDPEQDPDPVSLHCKADGLPIPKYTWLKNGEQYDPSEDEDDEPGRVEMLENEGTLVFHDPKVEDEGSYQCVAANDVGIAYSDITHLRRAVIGSFPKADPQVMTAQLGQSLGIPCEAPDGYPEPNVHWVLQTSDGGLKSLDSERITVDEEGTLWFSYVKPEDASEDALYACAASSVTRSEYKMGNWVYLNVSIPAGQENIDDLDETYHFAPEPQFVSEDEILAESGEEVKIYCIYGGYPVPEVKWWRQSGEDVDEEQLAHYGKVLLFNDLDQDDEDIYFCQAFNDEGEGPVHEFNIQVQAAPEFVVSPKIVNLPQGESAIFECEAEGNPEPKISWTMNGDPIESSEPNKLVFETLDFNDKGVIACNASNSVGYVYTTVYLNVRSLPPEWLNELEDQTVLEGEPVTLDCDAYGSPDPEIFWYRVEDNEDVPITEDDMNFDIEGSKLTIRSMSSDDVGDYKCTAENKFNSITSTAHVAMRGQTSVDLHVEEERVHVGQDAVFHCDITVDPDLTASITWLKDDDPIDTEEERYFVDGEGSNDRDNNDDDDGDGEEDDEDKDGDDWQLTIHDVRGSDSGVYTCVAKTDLDGDRGNAILFVEDVPNPPQLMEVECEARKAYIRWASGGDNNSPLESYTVQYVTQLNPEEWTDEVKIPSSDNHYHTRIMQTTYLMELKPGLNYTVRVLAHNGVGTSEPSEDTASCVSPGEVPPFNPRNVTVGGTTSSNLVIAWDPMEPEDHSGSHFSYLVSWRMEDGDDDEGDDEGDDEETVMEVPSTADLEEDEEEEEEGWNYQTIEDWEETELVLEDQPTYVRYEVRVEAQNEYGVAPGAETVVGYSGEDEPLDPPDDVDIDVIDATTAVLTWSPVDLSSVRGVMMGYKVDVWTPDEDDDDHEADEDEEISVSGIRGRLRLTDLTPFTDYRARVRVMNTAHLGPYSATINFKTPEGLPGPVSNLKVHLLSSDSFTVEWDEPEEPNGVVDSYVVAYELLDEHEEPGPELEYQGDIDPEHRMVKLANLEEESTYRVTVRAVTAAGEGEGTSMDMETEIIEPMTPVVPIFSYSIVEDDPDEGDDDLDDMEEDEGPAVDRDGDGDVDATDRRHRYTIISDTDGDGDVDEDDVLDTDGDGDVDEKDVAVADIDNDGDVDEDDIGAADRDGDGDVDRDDIGDEDGDGDFDGDDVIAADEDEDGDIDAKDDDEEDTLLEDQDGDGDIDMDDVIDTDGDGDVDEKDVRAADVDNDGDVDEDDLKAGDTDGDGDIDAADVVDLDGDGHIDGDDLEVRDRDGDGDIDKKDFHFRHTFLMDTDGDGDVDIDDVLDTDGDGDIDEEDHDVADIDNDGDVDEDDIKAADRDGDGDIDAADIGDEDGDGDIDGDDVLKADEDGDGDIDSTDDDEENTLLEDRDGDGDFDAEDLTDTDGDGDIDKEDFDAADVDNDGDIDKDDLIMADIDGDGDVDAADITDMDNDGRIDGDDLAVTDRDGDGDVDVNDFRNRRVFLGDTDQDGDVDADDVLDADGDGDVDEEDVRAADLDDDGDVDEDDLKRADKDGDGDIDMNDFQDVDGDGLLDEDDLETADRDADGDVDEDDYLFRNVFLKDTDHDGDIDMDDVLDTDGDGDIDADDVDLADINNDGVINRYDIRAGDRDGDGDIDVIDIGDEDGDGDVDAEDVKLADRDGDGDIDASDDDGENMILRDNDGDGDVDAGDVTDLDGDGDVDNDDRNAADIDNDGDVDRDDIFAADRDGDGDVDGADIIDFDGDGDVDAADVVASDRDGDNDIDAADLANRKVILKDTDGDGDIDEDDVLDTDGDGDVDEEDIAVADIDGDGDVDSDDVVAGDQDGDGDVDIKDVGDQDGDGDVDGDDVERADADGDGDIDAADVGRGIDVRIRWQPDPDQHSGSDFYVEYRPLGSRTWRASPVEDNHLYQVIRGLDPRKTYEVRMIAKDGDFETPSEVMLIEATEGERKTSSLEELLSAEDEEKLTRLAVEVYKESKAVKKAKEKEEIAMDGIRDLEEELRAAVENDVGDEDVDDDVNEAKWENVFWALEKGEGNGVRDHPQEEEEEKTEKETLEDLEKKTEDQLKSLVDVENGETVTNVGGTPDDRRYGADLAKEVREGGGGKAEVNEVDKHRENKASREIVSAAEYNPNEDPEPTDTENDDYDYDYNFIYENSVEDYNEPYPESLPEYDGAEDERRKDKEDATRRKPWGRKEDEKENRRPLNHKEDHQGKTLGANEKMDTDGGDDDNGYDDDDNDDGYDSEYDGIPGDFPQEYDANDPFVYLDNGEIVKNYSQRFGDLDRYYFTEFAAMTPQTISEDTTDHGPSPHPTDEEDRESGAGAMEKENKGRTSSRNDNQVRPLPDVIGRGHGPPESFLPSTSPTPSHPHRHHHNHRARPTSWPLPSPPPTPFEEEEAFEDPSWSFPTFHNEDDYFGEYVTEDMFSYEDPNGHDYIPSGLDYGIDEYTEKGRDGEIEGTGSEEASFLDEFSYDGDPFSPTSYEELYSSGENDYEDDVDDGEGLFGLDEDVLSGHEMGSPSDYENDVSAFGEEAGSRAIDRDENDVDGDILIFEGEVTIHDGDDEGDGFPGIIEPTGVADEDINEANVMVHGHEEGVTDPTNHEGRDKVTYFDSDSEDRNVVTKDDGNAFSIEGDEGDKKGVVAFEEEMDSSISDVGDNADEGEEGTQGSGEMTEEPMNATDGGNTSMIEGSDADLFFEDDHWENENTEETPFYVATPVTPIDAPAHEKIQTTDEDDNVEEEEEKEEEEEDVKKGVISEFDSADDLSLHEAVVPLLVDEEESLSPPPPDADNEPLEYVEGYEEYTGEGDDIKVPLITIPVRGEYEDEMDWSDGYDGDGDGDGGGDEETLVEAAPKANESVDLFGWSDEGIPKDFNLTVPDEGDRTPLLDENETVVALIPEEAPSPDGESVERPVSKKKLSRTDIEQGLREIEGGLEDLEGGLEDLEEGLGGIGEDGTSIRDGIEQIQKGLSEVEENMKSMLRPEEDAEEGDRTPLLDENETAVALIPEEAPSPDGGPVNKEKLSRNDIEQGLREVEGGLEDLEGGLGDIGEDVTSIRGGIEKIQEGLSEVEEKMKGILRPEEDAEEGRTKVLPTGTHVTSPSSPSSMPGGGDNNEWDCDEDVNGDEICGDQDKEIDVEDPTIGAVMEDSDPMLWTWFIVAVMVAVTMVCIVLFSIWVYNYRLVRVAELRAALYKDYMPPPVEEKMEAKNQIDVEAGPPDAVEEELTAQYQRQENRKSWHHVQMAAMMRRQATVQSEADSFASHDDDFAEYGDETMVGQTETLV